MMRLALADRLLAIGNFSRCTFNHRLRSAAIDLLVLDWTVLLLFVAVIIVNAIIVLIIAVIALILDRRLSLGSKNDTIVMFGVLKIVFRYHAITTALRITRKSGIFFGDVLSISPDFNIRAVALIITGKWVGTFAVIVTASAHAPILLYWPHTYLFSENQGR